MTDPGSGGAGTAAVEAALAGAQAAALERRSELSQAIGPAGAVYGDQLSLPQPPSGPGVGKSGLDLPVQGEGY